VSLVKFTKVLNKASASEYTHIMSETLQCGHSKASYTCHICHGHFCKNCVEFLEEGHFNLMPLVPQELKGTVYCQSCYQAQVWPQISAYEETVANVKNFPIYEKSQSKETRLMNRKEKPIQISDARDREDIFMKLAYQAFQNGFDAIVDVEMKSHKTHQGSYVLVHWTGSGIPVKR
jgi:regulator of sigma D